MLGGASGGLVDLDLDTAESVAVARAYFGQAPSFGRASSPQSHYLVKVYGLPDDFTRRALRRRAVEGGPKGGEVFVEVRGNRHQTMFPPSVHPSGEQVEWGEGWGDFRNVLSALEAQALTLDVLTERAERVYQLALLARSWPAQGSRHDVAVAVAGWMGHSGWGEAEARRAMQAICSAAGDTAELSDRLTAVGSTFARLAARQQVQGYRSVVSMLGEAAVAPAGALTVCSLVPQPTNQNVALESPDHVPGQAGASEPSAGQNQPNQQNSANPPSERRAQSAPSAFSGKGLTTDTPPNRGGEQREGERGGDASGSAAASNEGQKAESQGDERAAFLRYADAYQLFLEEQAASLVWYQGDFWDYRGGSYSISERGRIRAEVRRAVAPAAAPSTLGNVLSVLEDRLTIGVGRAALADPPLDLDTGAALEGGPFLVFENGTVDLGTNSRLLFPHSPSQFHTRRIPHSFPEGEEQCPRWMQCLRDWFGDQDRATPRMLAQWFGYVLSGDLSHERILSVVGAADAGKSTLAWVLEQLVGRDVVVPSSLSSIAGRFGLQSFQGKALAVFAEARTAARIDTSLAAGRILGISGRDVVEVEKKNRDAVAVRLPTRLMFVSNKLPSIGDDTGAFHRRLLVVGFHRSLDPDKRDPQLRQKLAEEMPGILRWSLRGLEDLRHHGSFAETIASQQARQEDLSGLSPMRAWASEALRFDRRCETDTAKLRASFEEWSEREGIEPITPHAFSRQFRDTFGLAPGRHRDRRVFKGVCLGA